LDYFQLYSGGNFCVRRKIILLAQLLKGKSILPGYGRKALVFFDDMIAHRCCAVPGFWQGSCRHNRLACRLLRRLFNRFEGIFRIAFFNYTVLAALWRLRQEGRGGFCHR